MKTPYANASLKVIKELRNTENDIEVTKAVPYYGEIGEVSIEENGALKTSWSLAMANESALAFASLMAVVLCEFRTIRTIINAISAASTPAAAYINGFSFLSIAFLVVLFKRFLCVQSYQNDAKYQNA